MAEHNNNQIKRALLTDFIIFFISLILILIAFTLEINLLLSSFIFLGLTGLIFYYGYRAFQNYLKLRR